MSVIFIINNKTKIGVNVTPPLTTTAVLLSKIFFKEFTTACPLPPPPATDNLPSIYGTALEDIFKSVSNSYFEHTV